MKVIFIFSFLLSLVDAQKLNCTETSSQDVLFLVDTSFSMDRSGRVNTTVKSYLLDVYDIFMNGTQNRIGVSVFGFNRIGPVVPLDSYTKLQWEVLIEQEYQLGKFESGGNTPMAEGVQSARISLEQNVVDQRPRRVIILSDGLPQPLANLKGTKPIIDQLGVSLYDVGLKPRIGPFYYCGGADISTRRADCYNIAYDEYMLNKTREQFLITKNACIEIGFLGVPTGTTLVPPDLGFYLGLSNRVGTKACNVYQNPYPLSFCNNEPENRNTNLYKSGIKQSLKISGCLCQSKDDISLVDYTAASSSNNPVDWYDLTYSMICNI